MRLLLTALCALPLAACGANTEKAADNAQNAAAAASNAGDGIDYVAAIGNMSESDQSAVFFRAIRDAGIACREVVKVEKTDPWQGIPSWLADCEQGEQHLIQVRPDGSANVVSRTTR